MRLKNSLDSVPAINQRVVRELQTNNIELGNGLIITHDTGKMPLESISSLEGENNELLKAVQLLLDKECQLGLSQLDQHNSRIQSLQTELEGANVSHKGTAEQLLMATADIALLDKYKQFLQ